MHELTLAFVPAMVQRRAGAILNVASLAAFQPLPDMATYAATKAFVQSFSEALHAELAGTGVSCTTLSPGPSPTEFGAVSGTADTEWVLSFASVAPEDVVSAAVRGMLRGRRSVIPGVAPKALAAVWLRAACCCPPRARRRPGAEQRSRVRPPRAAVARQAAASSSAATRSVASPAPPSSRLHS